MNVGSLIGNDKLVRRAAETFRQWMVTQTESPIYDGGANAIRRLDNVITKAQEAQKWTKRFLAGNKPRIQHERDTRHVGILNREVYESIVTNMIPDLVDDIVNNSQIVTSILKTMVDNKIVPLTVQQAIEEIRIITQEWKEVNFRGGVLSLLVKNVCLTDGEADVELGPFRVNLNLNNPMGGLRIVAVDDSYDNENGYSHPHVEDKYLCAGDDGGDTMSSALSTGRLVDYFSTVEAILRTYNGDSPHNKLSEWYDPSHEDQSYCEDCSSWVHNESVFICNYCDNLSCERCLEGNECSRCGEWYCEGCIKNCRECERYLCNKCSIECENCNSIICNTFAISCSDCSDSACSDCISNCDCCGKDFCGDCDDLDETCEKCGYDICKSCKASCNECEEKMCMSCAEQTHCKTCGVSVCEDCDALHDCLLKNVS